MSPSFRLDGLNALVTGAASGIGASVALALAEAGANVACHGNRRAPDETCAKIDALGRRSLPLRGDLSAKETSSELVERVVRELGSVDLLINNAGMIRRSPAVEYSEEDWASVIEVNLSSVFRLCQSAGRAMLAKGSGKIVNVASLLSFQGGINVPAYAASKGGVAQLTKALANEWAARGVNVNAIAPGYIATENTVALRNDATRSRQILERIPAGRWGDPEDIAGAAVFLCSPASNYVTGHVLVVDGGWLGR
ncbi:MAG: 2-dehydro-3-deoxy-D-gluconate 5-dehydrogenase KduD [Myxococcales bacterium]